MSVYCESRHRNKLVKQRFCTVQVTLSISVWSWRVQHFVKQRLAAVLAQIPLKEFWLSGRDTKSKWAVRHCHQGSEPGLLTSMDMHNTLLWGSCSVQTLVQSVCSRGEVKWNQFKNNNNYTTIIITTSVNVDKGQGHSHVFVDSSVHHSEKNPFARHLSKCSPFMSKKL